MLTIVLLLILLKKPIYVNVEYRIVIFASCDQLTQLNERPTGHANLLNTIMYTKPTNS